jgi:class 3 adenylate cyclase
VDLQGSLDDEIEVSFCISPAVRQIRYHDPERVHLREDLAVMHISPSIPPNEFHEWFKTATVTDAVLLPKETRVVEIEARRGWHAFLAPAVHALCFIIARDVGPSEMNLELFDGQTIPAEIEVRKGTLRIRVTNTLDIKLPVVVTFLGDDTDTHPEPNYTIGRFLNGKRVLTNQTFRSLFKAETLEVGTGLQLKNLTVLFTDLQASTAMYERVGDLNALGIVRRHFEVLESVVTRNRGAVVKTIGDAVMAVFPEQENAVAASTEMIDTVRRAVAHGEDLVLKIGIHSGPCVAIQSNNQVDYFGRTVNIAARVQSLASGGEIVCSEDVWQAAGVQALISARGLAVRKETAGLKGILDRFPVRRIVVAAALASPRKRPVRKATPGRARVKAKAKPAVSRTGRAKAPVKKRARAS